MIDGIAAAALLLIVGYWYYRPWQNVCTDIGRQIVFEKRDALFDMARAGELSFDDPDYRTIRQSLETAIRLAHEMTIWKHYIVRAWMKNPNVKRRQTDLDAAIARIENPETRAKVQKLVTQSYVSLFGVLLLKSPALLIFLMPIIAIAVVKAIITATQAKAEKRVIDFGNEVKFETELCAHHG